MTRPRERGTASIEMIGMFPLIAFGLVALLYTMVALSGIRSAVNAARDGAREYAVTSSFSAGSRVAKQAVPSMFHPSVSSSGGHAVSVTVTLPGLLGIPGTNFTSRAVMP